MRVHASVTLTHLVSVYARAYKRGLPLLQIEGRDLNPTEARQVIAAWRRQGFSVVPAGCDMQQPDGTCGGHSSERAVQEKEAP